MQVKATDCDLGVNAQISYRLSSQTDHDHVFSVDADTGQIYIRSALDYERSARYQLTVMASDGGGTRNQLMNDDGARKTELGTNVTAPNKVNPIWIVIDSSIALKIPIELWISSHIYRISRPTRYSYDLVP